MTRFQYRFVIAFRLLDSQWLFIFGCCLTTKVKNSRPHMIRANTVCCSCQKETHMQHLKSLFKSNLTKKNIGSYPTQQQPAQTTPKFSIGLRFYAQAVGIAAITLPSHSIASNTQLDHVVKTKILTVASVSGNSTYFKSEGFMHGFGYDLVRAYANNLGVRLDFKTYANTKQALNAVTKGKADLALTTAGMANLEKNTLAPVSLSCGNNSTLKKYNLNTNVNWSFADATDPLAQSANNFLCQSSQVQTTKRLAAFYDQRLMQDSYNKMHFNKAMQNRLPAYKASFQKHATNNKHDWQLLVAMGYQESHLKANAVSPTGVKGIMMLTSNTAKAMGVTNRIDPSQSINGGAKYLKLMKNEFKTVPEADRLWFALAGYNMGPAAIKRIQRKLNAAGKDGNSWSVVYQYMADNASKNRRYIQCMHYVTRIRSYLETLKMRT